MAAKRLRSRRVDLGGKCEMITQRESW